MTSDTTAAERFTTAFAEELGKWTARLVIAIAAALLGTIWPLG